MVYGALAVLLMMLVIFLVGVRSHDVSLVDRVWGLGFILAMAGYLYGSTQHDKRAWLVFVLLTLWGLRLSWHLHRRNQGQPEDPRYTAMRLRYGPAFVWQSFYRVNLLQWAILLIVSAPLFVVAQGGGPETVTIWDGLGFALFLIGFLFETMGDAQLKAFRADPANRGQVFRRGLWSLTRHPNYFGDATLWWGFWLFSLSVPGGAWTCFGPLLMTVLLRRVSGVTLLESDLRQRKPAYALYMDEVPAFFPRLWPRNRTVADSQKNT